MTKEERIQKAVALFKEGYNCSQSVVGAYADMYGFYWQVWNVVPWKGQTGKERLPIINWYRNWLKSLRKNVEPSIAANCWACQRKNLL